MAATEATVKPVVQVVTGRRLREGAGFIVRRGIGSCELADSVADPFLLLDELGPREYGPGEFVGTPYHPHRGFQTVTYVLSGVMAHDDSLGNTGVLRSGDVQWMTAGSGIIHAEGKDHPGGLLHGFQLWINLPAADKMCAPDYQDMSSESFPVVNLEGGGRVKVISGSFGGARAATMTRVAVTYLDCTVAPGFPLEYSVPEHLETCLIYVFGGGACVCGDGSVVSEGQTGVMGRGSLLRLSASTSSPVRVLVLAGQPLREPISRRGPFVMNTEEELLQAFQDYARGRLAVCKASFRSRTAE